MAVIRPEKVAKIAEIKELLVAPAFGDFVRRFLCGVALGLGRLGGYALHGRQTGRRCSSRPSLGLRPECCAHDTPTTFLRLFLSKLRERRPKFLWDWHTRLHWQLSCGIL